MKPIIHIIRVIVGLLFIFSGLVKAIDPLGLSYKMQEFFELWGMHRFDSWTLWLSLAMNAFEIIAGFALLIGWRIRLFIWLLLLLILFFTFLTGYAYLSGKFKNCGCFGDCIPITPFISFLKDVMLTLLIGLLFAHKNKIRPLFGEKTSIVLMLLVTLFSLGLQWYSLTYLPPVDCLPYKKGNNIPEKMKMPADAVPDSTIITFVYEKDGKQVEFTADQFPADFNDSYKFVSRYDKVVRKGRNNEPPIKGFVLTDDANNDSTQVILDKSYAVLVIMENFNVALSKWKSDMESLYKEAAAKNIPLYFVTGNIGEAGKRFRGTAFAGAPQLKCDFTALRTAARVSPTIYLLKKGTIAGKQSYMNTDDITKTIKTLPVQQPLIPASLSGQPADTQSAKPVQSTVN